MGKRKVKWQAGDNFLVPLEDGSFGSGQILSYEAHAMNSAICAFSSLRFEEVPAYLEPIAEAKLISVRFVTRDLLDSGRWKIVNHGPIIPWRAFLDIDGARSRGYIGVVIQGSFIIANFLSAFHKLIPWNHYFDPEYFDKLLISPDRKPTDLFYK